MVTTAVAVRPSGDRKVTPCVRRQGSKDNAVLQNAYGLPAGDSCPDRTPFCDGCYAEALENQWSSVSRMVRANWYAHQRAGDNVVMHVSLLDTVLAQFCDQFERLSAQGRVTPDEFIFRIHWDGDLYSQAYTEAWRRIIQGYSDVQFWIYTRSFEYATLLEDLPNVAVYLSVDAYNVDKAAAYLQDYPRLHAAFCATTQAECAELAASIGRKAAPCPENVGRLPLVVHKSGRRTIAVKVGSDGQGACAACRLCVDGVRDVAFATSKR